jgi:hypothetical protein
MSINQDTIDGLIQSYEEKLSQVGPQAVLSNLALWSGVSVCLSMLLSKGTLG